MAAGHIKPAAIFLYCSYISVSVFCFGKGIKPSIIEGLYIKNTPFGKFSVNSQFRSIYEQKII